MKKLWLLIAANLFLTACGGVRGIIPAGATSEVKPKIGDTVLYQTSREGFYEGVVEGVEGTRYKVKTGDSVNLKEESDVYMLPKTGAKTAAAGINAGDIVAAKTDSGLYWGGAEVLSVKGDVVEVKDLYYGKTANLSPDKILAIRPAAAAELQKVKAEKEFSAKAVQAKPRPPVGYKPKVGERVVARWSGNTWYDGEVAEVKGDKAKIKWQSFKESELGLENVMPYPKPETATAMPVANSYVLIKPEGGSGQWTYAQVATVNGDSAEVKFANGKTRSIKADEYIALN